MVIGIFSSIICFAAQEMFRLLSAAVITTLILIVKATEQSGASQSSLDNENECGRLRPRTEGERNNKKEVIRCLRK